MSIKTQKTKREKITKTNHVYGRGW